MKRLLKKRLKIKILTRLNRRKVNFLKKEIIIVSALSLILLVGCGKKAVEETVSENSVPVSSEQTSEDGFEDLNGKFITSEEFKQQQESYYDLIKAEQFYEALDIAESLKANAHLSGLDQEMLNEFSDNHNALIDLDAAKEQLKIAENEKRPELEGEIIPKIERLKETQTDTQEVSDVINLYEEKVETVFTKLSKENGTQRYTPGERSDGNEDFDENGNVKTKGGTMVDQDPISEDNVETNDDVYGND